VVLTYSFTVSPEIFADSPAFFLQIAQGCSSQKFCGTVA
jgi:hypothetical protein